MIVPVVYSLLMASEGQVPAKVTYPGDQFYWVGPITAATMQLQLQYGAHPQAAYALFRVMSTALNESAWFRVVSADDGPANLHELGRVSNTRPGAENISNDAVFFTDELNAIITAGVRKNIGWQHAGDNANQVAIWNVRLEIGWQLTPPTTVQFVTGVGA